MEKYFITPLGNKLLRLQEQALSDNVANGQRALGELIRADPGDGPHDGQFIQENMKVGMNEIQLQDIRYILARAEVIEKPNQTENVDIGHEVLIKLSYADGFSEELNAIILGKAESTIISSHLPENFSAVSDQSIMGTSIIGKKVGDKFKYQTGTQTINGQIKNIHVWEKGFE